MKKMNKSGGGSRGSSPWGASPLWGREGVTLLIVRENKKMTGKREF
jgi:hypothetical protein